MYNTWKIENGELIYSCGCKFKIKQERDGHFPLIYPGNPYKDWNYECEATKMLLADGNTIGVFQLESNLGKHWCKRLKPETTEHMSALASILRPGCLECINEKGISTTEMYCRYKNAEEIATPEIKVLGPLLEKTYYQMLYQEDAMRIATEIAGFTGDEADALRKGIGKKLPEVIAKLKTVFIEGCKKVGKVNEEEAVRIFENIEKSQRYSFNLSHALVYGMTAQITAFAKVHFPEYFYQVYLEGAKNKQKPLEERHKLVQDAKLFDIKITKPELSKSKKWFFSPKFKSILFGLDSVKHVGEKTINHVKEFCESGKEKWLDILIKCLHKIDSRAAESIIKAGIIDNGMSRKKQLHELNVLYQITAKGQLNFIYDNCDNFDNLKDLLKAMNKPKTEGGGLHGTKDIPKIDGLIYTLDNPGYSLEDSPTWISSVEEEILGIALSASVLDSAQKTQANTTCKELITGKDEEMMIIDVEISKSEQREIKTGKNKGKTYLKIDINDKTGIINGVMVWPEIYDKYGYLLQEKNTVCLSIKRNHKGDISIITVFQI